MQRPHPGLFPHRAQWRELRQAWRERDANPVLHYFRLARRRRRAALPGWRRNLPLLVGLGIGGATAYSLLHSKVFFSAADAGWRLGLAACLGLAVTIVGWLTQVLFDTLVSAACLLSQPGRRKLDLQADTVLLGTRATPADLLTGFVLPLLQALRWPLALSLLVCLLGATLMAYLEQPEVTANLAAIAQGPSLALLDAITVPWLQEALLLPLAWLGVGLAGMLAATALVLLFTCAGRGMRMDVHAGVLATLYALGALCFAWFTSLLTFPLRQSYSVQGGGAASGLASYEPWPFLLWLFMLLLVVFTALHFARRRGTALWLVYSLPLLFIGSFASLGFLATIWRHSLFANPTHFFLDGFFAWSMFAPVSAIAVPHPACLGTGFFHLLAQPQWHHFRWPLLIAAQFVLVCGLLRSALDAIATAREAGAE